MALEEYKRKRDFGQTPEPAGLARPRKTAAAPLSYVIQKHAARRLHYDFRLELDGVLKSWAVPKGPSLDPAEKRLAVHVEDHPIEYGGFEGVIPQGQYGGGTVLLWDRGTWQPLEADPAAAYRKGTLKFALDGEKLHGHWMLVRMGGKAANERHENWLLIKERDAVAVPRSGTAVVDDNPLSVDTGRSMDEIAADRDRVWDSHKGETTKDETLAEAKPEKPTKVKAAARKSTSSPVPGARKRAMPQAIKPQLATLVDDAPSGPEWLHEIKYDGYRLIGRVMQGEARLLTRSGLDWTEKFPALAAAMAELPVASALIDGEVVHLEPDGTSSFSGLQDALSTGRTDALTFFAFDLLHRDGWDLTGAILEDRKAALAEIIPPDAAGMLRYSDHQADRGPAFLRQACSFALEGIVSKRRDAPYREGRSDAWLKVKCVNREEFVVIGFSDPEGSRQGFGALALAYYDPEGTLRYAGRVGTGFNTKQLVALRRQFEPLERGDPPVKLPKGVSRKGVHWMAPTLVAEIQFAGWTGDAMIRHGSFQGLREDKSASEVVHDPNAPSGVAAAEPKPAAPPRPRQRKPAPSSDPTAAAAAADEEPLRPGRDGSVIFHGVRLSHADRVLYPDQGITKLDLARYYAAIADWALPYLGHRPLSLVRCPEGQGKECFYQKHATSAVPDVVGRVDIPEGAGTGTGTYTCIENLAGLLAMVQMGVLEIHPWGSTVDKLETPDTITFDFDPDVGLPWERVTEAAIDMREALLGIGLKSFPKTTGGKGLHVVVPVAPKLGWDDVKAFAKWVADRFVAEYPDRFTANMAKRARQGRIFIDYLRNGRGATAIGAYSARARSGAPVSVPISWEEVENGTPPDGLTVSTVPDRMARLAADPWADFRKIRQSLSAAVRRQVGI
ncbi:MAG: DNA ligase D [Alphaproteobacteria bacterium]|nr:DNA ligase D [Alphaproteobacteria bacterium]